MEDLVFEYNLTINSIKIVLKMKHRRLTARQIIEAVGVSRKTTERKD